MTLTEIKDLLALRLANEPEVLFALLHGSVLYTNEFRDIDIAVFLSLDDRIAAERAALDLEARLQDPALPVSTEVQLLNVAPPGFRYRVVSEGVPLHLHPDSGELALAEFAERAILDYLHTGHLRRIIAAGLRAA
jgi:predicted nucleotidyltransferase